MPASKVSWDRRTELPPLPGGHLMGTFRTWPVRLTMSVLGGKADLAGSWFIRKILEIKSENPLRHAPHCHDAPVPVANLTRNVDSVRTERPVEMMTDACLHAVLSFEVLA